MRTVTTTVVIYIFRTTLFFLILLDANHRVEREYHISRGWSFYYYHLSPPITLFSIRKGDEGGAVVATLGGSISSVHRRLTCMQQATAVGPSKSVIQRKRKERHTENEKTKSN